MTALYVCLFYMVVICQLCLCISINSIKSINLHKANFHAYHNIICHRNSVTPSHSSQHRTAHSFTLNHIRTMFICECDSILSITNMRKRSQLQSHTSLDSFHFQQSNCSTTSNDSDIPEITSVKKLSVTEKPYSQKWYREKQSHLSKNQKLTIREMWPHHGVDLLYGHKLNLHDLFTNTNDIHHKNQSCQSISNNSMTSPVYLDVGFGSGDSLIHHAINHPHHRCIGVEIHKASIATLLQNVSLYNISNIKVIRADVGMLLNQYLPDQCLDYVSVFFPDPWPNEFRDGERRVIRKSLLGLLSTKMKIGGRLRIATDVDDYARHVMAVIRDVNSVLEATIENRFRQVMYETHVPCEELPSWRPCTKYERKARDEPRIVHEFEYEYS